MLESPGLIVAGIEALNAQANGGGLAEEIASAERDLQKVQMEEDRAIRLYRAKRLSALRRGTQWFIPYDVLALFANSYDPKTGKIRQML